MPSAFVSRNFGVFREDTASHTSEAERHGVGRHSKRWASLRLLFSSAQQQDNRQARRPTGLLGAFAPPTPAA